MQQKNKKGIKWQNFEALAIVSDFSNPSFAQLNQYAPIFRKLIPIVTNNILLFIDFFLCTNKNKNNAMRILVDSGVTTNTVYKTYNRWIIT